MAHGHISNVPVGSLFDSRRALYLAGVHRDVRRGMCGSSRPGRGVESIVLSGKYEDDLDLGDVVYYTGQGGQDAEGRQVADQVMQGLNASLARNPDLDDPVRVVRRTSHGFRYDGIYAVDDAWIGPGVRGFDICRFRLTRAGDLPSDVANASVEQELAPAERRLATHFKMVRDGAVPRTVKNLYGHRCQICGIRLDTAGGPYAEGAHLVPLGAGHEGIDHISNILCLCPNHHVLLDHGAIALGDDWSVIDRSGDVLGQLTVDPAHGLSVSHAARHRALMGIPDVAPVSAEIGLGG